MKVGWKPAAFASVDHGIACDPELKRWALWLDFGATIHLKKKKKSKEGLFFHVGIELGRDYMHLLFPIFYSINRLIEFYSYY
jgi:hypothetical protein